MDLQLKDKKALVTGSTAGIGFAIASVLAREGANVIVNGRTPERVEETIERVKKEHPNAVVSGIAADLATAEGAEKIINSANEVDILINNVGIFEPKVFEEISDDDWLRFFETNVMSGIRLSRHYLPKMKARNWGRIIFVSSESGVNIPTEMIHYGMTKTAQLAIARGLAETTIGTEVTVNTILPGPTASEGVQTFVKQMAEESKLSEKEMEEQFFETVRPSSLIQRFIKPVEIGEFVAFLSSPLASATNGAALRAEGGILRSIA